MVEKLNITAAFQASPAAELSATKTGPVEEIDKKKRQIEDMFYRSDAKPLDGQDKEGEKASTSSIRSAGADANSGHAA